MRSYPSLFDELEKIAKSGPGSRGGKVMGYRKNGDPIYASEQKKPEMVPARKPSVAARVMGGGMSAGAMYAQAPLVRRYLQGKSKLYHGTTLDSAASILQSPTGIDPAYAGKAGRLNKNLMGESLVRKLEDHGVELTDKEKIKMKDNFETLMSRGKRSGKAATKTTKHYLKRMVSDGRISQEVADKMLSGLADDLSRFGHRTYFGIHPADVAVWGSSQKEKEMAADAMKAMVSKGQLATQARGYVDAVTGGIPSIVEDQIKRRSYRPGPAETMTRGQVLEEVRRLAEASKGLPKNQRARAVFGVSMPTGKMGYLEDFPGLKYLMGANPGTRHLVKSFGVQTYEPGRDISFPHEAPAKNIQSVDIVDPVTKKVRRIHVSDAVKAGRGKLLSRLRRAALPAAITGLGAYGLYRSIKPKARMVPKGHPLAEKEKTSSIAGRDWRRVARYAVPALAASAGLGVGVSALSDKVLPDKRKPGTSGKIEDEARKQARGVGAALATQLGSTAGGALIGALASKHRGRGALLGAGGGYLAGAFGGMPAVTGREAGKEPETMYPISSMPEKAQDFVRRNPWVGSAYTAGLTGALPLGALYAARKYYPVSYAKAKRFIAEGLRHFG